MAAARPDHFLPYGRQVIDDEDIAAVTAVLRGDWLTTGPKIDEFEEALARRTGARYAVVCNSGTAALHLAAMALELRQDDAVVVPTMTFLATANAPRYVGAEVSFADCDPDTGLITPAAIEAAMERAAGNRVRAVFPVHLNGQCAPMEEIWERASARGLAVVEDACHALGTTYGSADEGPVPVGSCRHSTMAVFSFHAVKTIAMGEGGAVTTNDPVLAERMKRLRSHGMARQAARFVNHARALDDHGEVNAWYYEMAEPGYNYRATDIQCALGLSQLARLDDKVARRRSLVARYEIAIRRLGPLVRPIGHVGCCEAAWHLFPVLIDFARLGMSRNTLMSRLRRAGVGTQVHYIPVHWQPYYEARYGARSLPGAEEYYARVLSLPLYPGMADADVDYVIETLQSALAAG